MIGMKVSKINKQATSSIDEDILFDSSKGTSPIYSIQEVPIDSTSKSIQHGLGFQPKTWMNSIGEYGNNDSRIPIEITPVLTEESVDYEIDSREITITDNITTRTARVIIFAKSIDSVDK